MSRYEDILYLPRHVSPKRQKMSNYDRAAQFSPFAALTGYDAAISEAGRLTESPVTLMDNALEELNETLCRIQAALPEAVTVQVDFFCPDERKAGGMKRSITGRVLKIDLYGRRLVLDGGREVELDGILRLEILGKREKM